MAEVLGPVETLRAAAAKLRATAEGTSVPPWYEDGQEGVYAYGAPGENCPTVFRDERVRYQDVLWMTLVNPEIAEPLAVWLDREADGFEINESACLAEALTVARVLLGVPDGR